MYLALTDPAMTRPLAVPRRHDERSSSRRRTAGPRHADVRVPDAQGKTDRRRSDTDRARFTGPRRRIARRGRRRRASPMPPLAPGDDHDPELRADERHRAAAPSTRACRRRRPAGTSSLADGAGRLARSSRADLTPASTRPIIAAAWRPSPSTVSTSSGTRRHTRQQQVAGGAGQRGDREGPRAGEEGPLGVGVHGVEDDGVRARAAGRRAARPGPSPPATRRGRPGRRRPGSAGRRPAPAPRRRCAPTASWTWRRRTNATSCCGAQVHTRSAGSAPSQRRLQLRGTATKKPSSSSSGCRGGSR